MVDHLNVSYLYKKRGVFYFSKRVPCDVRSYYKSDRIVICLKPNQVFQLFVLVNHYIKGLMTIGRLSD